MKRIDPLLTEAETSKVVNKAVQTLRNDRHIQGSGTNQQQRKPGINSRLMMSCLIK